EPITNLPPARVKLSEKSVRPLQPDVPCRYRTSRPPCVVDIVYGPPVLREPRSAALSRREVRCWFLVLVVIASLVVLGAEPPDTSEAVELARKAAGAYELAEAPGRVVFALVVVVVVVVRGIGTAARRDDRCVGRRARADRGEGTRAAESACRAERRAQVARELA